jgi:hypothetical protein
MVFQMEAIGGRVGRGLADEILRRVYVAPDRHHKPEVYAICNIFSNLTYNYFKIRV